MLFRPSAACLIASLIAVPAHAAPKQPIALAHSSKWEMKYDEDACTLATRFGEGKDSVLLVMTRYVPHDSFEMKFYSRALRNGGGIAMPVDVAFGAQPASRYDGLSATAGDAAKTPIVMLGGMRLDGWRSPAKVFDPAITPPAVTPEQEAGVTSITFKAAGKQPIQLMTGPMAAPMKAMRACTDDLLRHWGFDPAVQASLSRPAQPTSNPGDWLRSGDYPMDAIWKGENGLVRFRLDVEPDGSVSKCRVLYRTNPDSFADATCKLLQARARFTPALDAAGKPIKSLYLNQVRWMAGSHW